MTDALRDIALLLASLPAILVVSFLAARMLGVRRPLSSIVVSGLAGWTVSVLVALIVAGGDLDDGSLIRNTLVLAFIFTMFASVSLDLFAKPGSLGQGDAAALITIPRPKQYVQERVDVVRRSREIADIARRNGFGPQLGLRHRKDRHDVTLERDPAPVRARRTLEQCGGMFVKLGQIASTRADLLPPEFIEEFSKLQSNVAPADPAEMRELIEAELGASVETIFAEFDWDPIGTASIAQVYKATLRSGEPVVVKAQRPDIADIVRRDTEVLVRVSEAVERNTALGKQYRVSTLVMEFTDGVNKELDFRGEADNAEAIGTNMASVDGLRCPAVFGDFSTKRLLVQERFNGPEVSDTVAVDASGFDRMHLADVLLRATLKQMMTDGYFHADLHPGNVLLLEDGELGVIDFGACGRLDPLQMASLKQMLLATALRDAGMLRQAVMEVCEVDADLGDEALERALARFLALYVRPGETVSAGAVADLMELLLQFGIGVPVEFTTFGRALVVLEGTLRVICPEYRFADGATQVAQEWVGVSPTDKNLLHNEEIRDLAKHELMSLLPILREIPRQGDQVLRQLRRGELTTRISLFAKEEDQRFVSKMVNRAVLAFMGAIVGIMSVVLLVTDAGVEFAGDVTLLNFFGYLGLIGSTVIMLRVLAAILREGQN